MKSIWGEGEWVTQVRSSSNLLRYRKAQPYTNVCNSLRYAASNNMHQLHSSVCCIYAWVISARGQALLINEDSRAWQPRVYTQVYIYIHPSRTTSQCYNYEYHTLVNHVWPIQIRNSFVSFANSPKSKIHILIIKFNLATLC